MSEHLVSKSLVWHLFDYLLVPLFSTSQLLFIVLDCCFSFITIILVSLVPLSSSSSSSRICDATPPSGTQMTNGIDARLSPHQVPTVRRWGSGCEWIHYDPGAFCAELHFLKVIAGGAVAKWTRPRTLKMVFVNAVESVVKVWNVADCWSIDVTPEAEG